jgi:hypothetical protein
MPPEFDNVRSPLLDSSEQVWPDPTKMEDSSRILAVLARLVVGSIQIRLASDHGRNPEIFRPVSIGIWYVGIWRHGQMLPDSSTGKFLEIGCCRTLGPTGFQRPTMAEFWQSDIKRACKDKEFNFEKWFTILKTVNRFPKIN